MATFVVGRISWASVISWSISRRQENKAVAQLRVEFQFDLRVGRSLVRGRQRDLLGSGGAGRCICSMNYD